jgi:hypothetical protein
VKCRWWLMVTRKSAGKNRRNKKAPRKEMGLLATLPLAKSVGLLRSGRVS